ncbi:nuclear transport factor 2 family protein [Dyadobacter aurulentus]|uniref:nuclear transport factor 2 family protein n=1 Tax=Dyadobacter sp. UC 10 TaxID=2605428 RepID=UPI0011F1C8A1|nr:nuclear transport factor 2 family protein [Dyadobacter sp. UC 10]KAA0992270.1 nuclear transport factor 2 family protein [Dyadobacter sp. UC 10]
MKKNLLVLKETMEEVDKTWDFTPLISILSDNVVFEATIREGTPISGQFKGKKAVSDYFMKILPATAVFKQQAPMEFVAHDDKVIILGDDAYTLKKNNRTFRSPYAMIVTFDRGLITKILIIQDLSGFLEVYRNNVN